ncbi:MAG: hypothetical protein ROR55_28715 [Devosia sp.]
MNLVERAERLPGRDDFLVNRGLLNLQIADLALIGLDHRRAVGLHHALQQSGDALLNFHQLALEDDGNFVGLGCAAIPRLPEHGAGDLHQ